MGDFNVAPTELDIGIGEQNIKRWLREGKQHFCQKKLRCGIKLKILALSIHGENKTQMRGQSTPGLITALECLTMTPKRSQNRPYTHLK